MTKRLDAGEVLARVFGLYREQLALLLPAALLFFLPVAIAVGFLRDGGGVLLYVVAFVLGGAATYGFQGIVAGAAHDMIDGRRSHTVATLMSAVVPVSGPLLIVGLLASVAIGIGTLLIIIPGLLLMTIWALLAPVIVIERTNVLGTFSRSGELVRDHGVPVFMVVVVLFLFRIVLSLPIALILVAVSDSAVGYGLADLITNVLVSPLAALAASVMYFELKRLHGENSTAGVRSSRAPATEASALAPAPEAPAPTAPEKP